MSKNSIVIICKNIKIDKNYQNCLTYSENQMYQLCYDNKVNMANTFSFIREGDNVIRVPFSYQECLSSNYMAFQNPRYSNKWFFAFIDSVEYVSDGATNINFTVDEFSTWWSYWSPVETFVVREHTNDDTVGSNLLDEGLGLGDYVCQHVNTRLNPFNSFKPVVGVSECLYNNETTVGVPEFYENGGIFNGICYIVGDGSPYATSHIIRGYDACGKAGSVQYIFMAPTEIINSYNITYVDPLSGYDFPITYGFIENPASSYVFPGYGATFGSESDPYFYRPLAIGDFIPENKKLLTYPYCYLMVDPHDGNSYKFNYEDFEDIYYSFAVYGILTPGCSVKFVPLKYKGVAENYAYAFAGAKMPMCSWNSDAYTNWLTQNGVNLGFTTLNQNEIAGIAGAGSMALGGLLMATGIGGLFGAGLLATGATGIFSSMQSDYKASMMPDQVKGNQNTGDVNYSLHLINPTCYEMTIKEEKAKSIDEYFTRFGYKTNRLKTPNQTGRKYFNYVEIGKSEVIGYPKTTAGIPAESMEKINNIYRGGVTLWHDHSRIGNYAGNIITDPTPPTPPAPSPETTVTDTSIVVNDVNTNKTSYINLLGNTSQDGTPTPDAPKDVKVGTDNILVQISNSTNTLQTIHPVNLGDIELCKIGTYQDSILKSTGKNLFDNITENKVVASDGTINNNASWNLGNYIEVQPNTQYTFSRYDGTGQSLMIAEYNSSQTFIQRDTQGSISTNTPYTITTTANTKYVRLNYDNTRGNTLLQFEKGTSTSYEPYGIVWYVKKQVDKRILAGNDNIQSVVTSTNTTRCYFRNILSEINSSMTTFEGISNYLVGKNNWNLDEEGIYSDGRNIVFRINTSTIGSTSTTINTWLSTHNIKYYYALANPIYTVITDTNLTAQLNALYTAGLFSGTTRIISYTNGANPYIKLHYNIS